MVNSRFSSLADLYILTLCIGIIKQLKYTIAGVTKIHVSLEQAYIAISLGFASQNTSRFALGELESC